ncbi:DEAD/DEAH box helicase family protein [Gilvimarinus sp. 1_MG-2023]|uniref:DEAD/DEAH box helicase family protein n=1 Tax=Gilvimarinus sp. 1_MG-2023 TaxID=3062638 RepID=UPI0026E15270|nr:DEAD/DEAH box helicase family protein [Gilvimarinus sp. 1_MG-2023]MDO6748457.1 DEAD/DEAH box helicase family protein [Gilvimarinus sp. 1_MG-2023]
MAARKATPKAKKTLQFRHHLVLNQWLFSLFGFDSLNGNYDVGKREAPTLEAFRDRFQLIGETSGRNAEGEHLLVQRIRENLTDDALLSDEQLLEYDRRIKALTDTINSARLTANEAPIEWKYFQYLMLLFTEIYLDYLFTKPEELLEGLNQQIERWNNHWVAEQDFNHNKLKALNPEDDLWPQLNMVAYWSATGSGKTLIMHANILQYRYYLQRYGKAGDINKIILLTPNEGLTHQHLVDLEKSGIRASEFSAKGGDLFAQDVIVIDINKLRDSEKQKTVAVDSFGSRNLLLVDEGHRGTASGGGSWYEYRQKLCSLGFSFEYSATFAQSSIKHDNLRQTYTKAILFDYSYRHFYGDGYGKQSQILNIEAATKDDQFRYQMASLLSFYQQLRLFSENRKAFAPFNLQMPLWVFVTSKVTQGFNTKEANDMVQVLQFLDVVLSKKADSVAAIDTLLNQGMVGKGGVDRLHGRFNYLKELGESAEQLYLDLLERVFHCGGGRLHIENITGVAGEVALRGGTSDTPFGVINVGDDTKLVKLCDKHDLLVQDARFSESLFRGINREDSNVNLLLGAKKFTEGWSSWRVSNMTLLNVGKNEGAQIIQLFGRGVRLQGWNTTLKRSAELTTQLKTAGIERPRHIGLLETLNIFGVKADYIAQFKKELEDEDIPVNEGLEEFVLPLNPMNHLPDNLNVLRVKDSVANKAIGGSGSAFMELAEQVVLKAPKALTSSEVDYFCSPPRVNLDFYPQVGAFSTDRQGSRAVGAQQQWLKSTQLVLLDSRKLYFELLAFKRDRRWSNLTITQDVVDELLQDTGWYRLYAPDDAMKPGQLERLSLWHDMAIALLRKYCELFYGLRRKQWEGDKLEYRAVTEKKQHLPGVSESTPEGSYLITLDRERHKSLIKQLEGLREKVASNDVEAWDGQIKEGLEFIWCERHFYQPLLAATQGLDYQVTPTSLNTGEAQFVRDIHKAVKADVFEGYEVYLLRNQTGQGSVGVFIDGGFYPDFILWLVKGDKQKVIFVDPKGLRHHKPDDPKVRFHRTIKDIEADLIKQYSANSSVELHAFLISETHSSQLVSQWKDDSGQPVTKALMESWNILFREEDEAYVQKLASVVI